MRRSRQIVALCHCLLNANVKVPPLASHAGALELALERFASSGTGMFQLPCHETSFLGMSRWGMTSEQYDHPAFRRHCRRILEPCLDQLLALHREGCAMAGLVGVDGSPSCGMFRTCTGYRGGEIVRGALSGVHKGQEGAALSLGLTDLQTLAFVLLPQALRTAMLKDTSLVSVLAITELTRSGQLVSTRTFRAFEIYLAVAVMYFVLTYCFTLLARRLEIMFGTRA